MANVIKIKRGSGTPTTSNLAQYELGYDYTNDKLYIHDPTNSAGQEIVEITGSSFTLGPVADGATTIATGNAIYDHVTSRISGFVDTSGTPIAQEYARFTDANTIEGRSAAGVRTDLGLVIGTNVLEYNAELQTIAALNPTATEDGKVLSWNETSEAYELVAQSAGTITSVSGMTNNNVLTASGSTTISGESNLTFDGTELDVQGVGKFRGGSSEGLVLEVGQLSYNAAVPAIKVNYWDDTSGGTSGLTSGDHLEFYGPRYGFRHTWARGGAGGAVPVATLQNNSSNGVFELFKALNPTADATYQSNVKLNVNGNSFFRGGSVTIGDVSPLTVGGTPRLSLQGAGLNIGANANDLSYIRRIATGEYQWQTWNGANDGEIHLQPYGGKVGIGTATPLAKLHIENGTSTDTALMIKVQYDTSGGDRGKIQWRDGANITGSIHTEFDGTDVSMHFGSLYNSGYNTTTRMTLTGQGNLDVTGALTLGTALALAEGGTGATSAAAARLNLDLGDLATLDNISASLITSGTIADARIALSSITQHTDTKYLRSDAADTSTGKITFTNGMQDNVSNVGSVGGTGLEGNQLSTTDWANLPVGFGGMMRSGNQSYGNPGSNYFLFHKIANRDAGGGWGGIALGYNSNADFYVGHTTVSGSYATWSKVWNEANDGSGSGLDADLLDGQHGSYYENWTDAINLTGTIDDDRIPNLAAGKITSGTFADARIPSLAASKITSGTFGDARIPSLAASKITSGTFSSARMPASFAADSVTQDDITTRAESGFYQTASGTTGEGWPITNNTYQHMIATTHSNDSNYYSMQIAGSFYDQNFYGRKTNGSGTRSWLRFITTADEGSGNGFDADLLDGLHQSSFPRRGNLSENTASSITTFNSNAAINTSSGNQSGLQVYQTTGGADAFMTFHINGDHAVYFGLDGGTNDLAVGGWSKGANSYKVWHQGNDGSGSTLDADLLDGLQGSSYWSKSGSWVGDLASNGYSRVQGVSNGGGEFVLALKNGQLHTLVDGSYIAYEASTAAGGGFWSSYNSAYGNASGFKASANDKIKVQQLDGGTADLEVTGNIKLTNEKGLLWDYTPDTGLGGYIAHPGGGMYRTNIGTHTGALTITIPSGGGPADMISFWVDVFDYTSYESQSFYIAGYVYQTAGSNEWVNETAMMLTPKENHARTVRFGHNGTNHVVYIGELADTWSYPQVTVRNVQVGFASDVDTYDDNWDISFEASAFANVDATYSGADTLPTAGKIKMKDGAGKFVHNTTSSRDKIRVWNSSNYAIGMEHSNNYGGLANQYAMTFNMDATANRGFLWVKDGHSKSQGAMALTTDGKLTVAHSMRLGYGESDTTTPGATYRLDVSGSIGATADVVAYISSDKKLKDNIKNIPNPLEKLEKLNGVEFDWNDKQDLYKGHDIGVIAQEVEEVLPEIVDTREDGHKAVKYDRMVALLIEAVKEQQQQINELKEKLNG
jgi:hypothetical protein